MSTIAIILLATFAVADLLRIRPDQGTKQKKFEKPARTAAQSNEEAFESGATSAPDGADSDSPDASSESPAALAQEVSQGLVFSPAFNATVRKQQTLFYVKASSPVSQVTLLKVACDSNAFSCQEIIHLASDSSLLAEVHQARSYIFRLFAQGRNNTGCISDPANVKSLVDFYASKFPGGLEIYGGHVVPKLSELRQALIDNASLKPAGDVGPPPMQLQIGLRTKGAMDKLLRDMKDLQLMKTGGSPGSGGLCGLGSRTVEEFRSWSRPMVEEFLRWLRQIRSSGEQFSGPQLLSLVKAIPEWCGSPQIITGMLLTLDQYVTGVTCEEVLQIMPQMLKGGRHFLTSLYALKSNIVDGQNKADIVAFVDRLYFFWQPPDNQWPRPLETMVKWTAKVLQNLGVGLPPKNNPIFGVVKGNPVILVVDESTSMDASFTLGADTFTQRKFCNIQLEAVLRGLLNGTYFNVIQYSSSAVKIFPKPVLVDKTSIDAAMEAMGTTWRSNYAPGQDPVEMIKTMKVFALEFKRRLKHRSTKRNTMEALQLAYAAADSPLHGKDKVHVALGGNGLVMPAIVFNKRLPQIYFLTSGQPDGAASQILHNIDEFSQGRNIPVNSIAFTRPADLAAKQFVKDLAQKTGGFSRSIEQAGLHTNKRKRELSDKSVIPTESDVP